MEYNYLPLFITEEVFIVQDNEQAAAEPSAPPTVKDIAHTEQPVSVGRVAEPITPPTPKITVPKAEPIIHDLAIWCPALSAEDKNLIGKILQAIHKDIHKVHVMEGADAYTTNYKTLICFGFQKELSARAGTDIVPYTPLERSGKKVLVAVAPAKLHGDATQKKRLWEALQKMFL